MSKLYYTESGRFLPALGEELTTFRRARKVLTLPKTSKPARLFFIPRPYEDSNAPLRLSVNGKELAPIVKQPSRIVYQWHAVTLEPGLLRAGENVFEFWCDATAMNGWALAMEGGFANPASFTTDDGGANWRNHHMSYLNVDRGEYLVRVRLEEGEDPAPPPMVYEDPANPRLASYRKLFPAEALEPGPILKRVRALSTWIANSWEHTAAGPGLGTVPMPWDPETIHAWASMEKGHAGQRPIANCIFYGVTFAAACQALGIPARCSIFSDKPAGGGGHFTAEYWSNEHEKWCMVDPNFDAMFLRNGVPLSVTELQDTRKTVNDVTEYGPGAERHRQNPRTMYWFDDGSRRARSINHRSVWYRSDILSHPEFNPAAHGAGVMYSETGIVWEQRDMETWPMFPYFGDRDYFDAPPRGFGK